MGLGQSKSECFCVVPGEQREGDEDYNDETQGANIHTHRHTHEHKLKPALRIAIDEEREQHIEEQEQIDEEATGENVSSKHATTSGSEKDFFCLPANSQIGTSNRDKNSSNGSSSNNNNSTAIISSSSSSSSGNSGAGESPFECPSLRSSLPLHKPPGSPWQRVQTRDGGFYWWNRHTYETTEVGAARPDNFFFNH